MSHFVIKKLSQFVIIPSYFVIFFESDSTYSVNINIMPKYEWYFKNKGDDVCKHVNYNLLLIYNLQSISAEMAFAFGRILTIVSKNLLLFGFHFFNSSILYLAEDEKNCPKLFLYGSPNFQIAKQCLILAFGRQY